MYLEFVDDNKNFYILAGTLSCFLEVLTTHKSEDFQFSVNALDFEDLKDTVMLCVTNIDSVNRADWQFLTSSE